MTGDCCLKPDACEAGCPLGLTAARGLYRVRQTVESGDQRQELEVEGPDPGEVVDVWKTVAAAAGAG